MKSPLACGAFLCGALSLLSFGCAKDTPSISDAGVDAGPGVCTGSDPGDPGCATIGWRDCAPPFQPDDSGWGCAPIMPDADCPPGTMAVLGQTTCAPVGTTGCADGFAPDPSGWGCTPVVPPSACPGATLAALGSTTCTPLGDCGAPFPPAEATYFVDASFTAAQLDSTHFQTISAALAAAPAGSTIAVERGQYAEALALSRAVTLVGRCAEQVVLSPGAADAPGLKVSAAGVVVSGMTLTGFHFGLQADAPADVQVRECVFEASHPYGIFANNASKVSLSQVAVRGTVADSSTAFGFGVVATSNAQLTLDGCELSGNGAAGLLVDGAGTHLALQHSVVRDTLPASGKFGSGIRAQAGGAVDVTASALLDNQADGVHLQDVDTRATIADSVIDGVGQSGGEAFGVGGLDGTLILTNDTVVGADEIGVAEDSASLTMTDSVIRANGANAPSDQTGGAFRAEGGNVTLQRTAMVANVGGGATLIEQSTSALTDVLIRDSSASAHPSTGRGLTAQTSSQVTGTRVTLVGNTTLSAWAYATASMTLDDAILDHTLITPGQDGGLGLAVQVGGGAQFKLHEAFIRDSASTAVEVGDMGSTAELVHVVAREIRPDPTESVSGVVGATSGGQLSIDGFTLVDNIGSALHVEDADSVLTASHGAILDNHPLPTLGLLGRGIEVQTGASATLSDLVVAGNAELGVMVASSGTVAKLERVVTSDSRPVLDGQFGYAAIVFDGASAEIRESAFASSPVGLVVSDGSVLLSDCRLARNQVALDVQGQTSLQQVDTLPAAVVPGQCLLSSDTLFEENQSRLGSGNLALPELHGL